MDLENDVRREVGAAIAQTIAKKIAIGIALFIAFLLFIVVGGVVVQWLWNWLVPDIFGVRRVTIWEALGLLTLSRILFGGFGRGGGGAHGPSRHRREWWKKGTETRDADGPSREAD